MPAFSSGQPRPLTALEKYAKVVEQRAARLNISPEAAETLPEEQLAGFEDIPRERLEALLTELAKASYPGKDCLAQTEIDALLVLGIPAEALRAEHRATLLAKYSAGSPAREAALGHLIDCADCRLLLTASRPRRALLDEFVERALEAEHAEPKVAPRPALAPTWSNPAAWLGFVSGGGLAALVILVSFALPTGATSKSSAIPAATAGAGTAVVRSTVPRASADLDPAPPAVLAADGRAPSGSTGSSKAEHDLQLQIAALRHALSLKAEPRRGEVLLLDRTTIANALGATAPGLKVPVSYQVTDPARFEAAQKALSSVDSSGPTQASTDWIAHTMGLKRIDPPATPAPDPETGTQRKAAAY